MGETVAGAVGIGAQRDQQPETGGFAAAGHIGGAPDLVLVTRNEHTVAGHDQIRLDVIGALLDGQPIALEGMFRAFSARTAVRNHDNV